MNATTEVLRVPLSSIRETPENWEIYKRPEADDQFPALVDSVASNGVLEPITVSSDMFILSGHRRHAAARDAYDMDPMNFFPAVPVIVIPDIKIGPMPSDERIKILIAHNRGSRVKTTAESVAEAMASVDPEAAIREAKERKAKVYALAQTSTETVSAGTGSRRTNPLKQRGEFLEAVELILRNTKRFPITQRNIHYRLLSLAPLMSKGKRGQRYGQTGDSKGDTGKLSKLLTDARSARLIDDELISDGTRPEHYFEVENSVGEYVASEVGGMFKGYFSNVHREQSAHVEILIEKNTLFDLLRIHVAQELRIPITSGRGYVSYPVGCRMRDRFKKSGKDKFVLIYVSDHDPEGIDMPSSWKAYFKIDHGIDADVVRAAVTLEQIRKYNLPPDAQAKVDSSRYTQYIANHGHDVWELDSMDPDDLIEEVKSACLAWMDVGILNAAMKREQEDDVKLARLNAAVAKLIPDLLHKLEPSNP
jgi:hypothetical protein